MKKWLLILGTACLLVYFCSGNKPEGPDPDDNDDNTPKPLIGTTWLLETFGCDTLHDVTQDSDTYSIVFNDSSSAALVIDCNTCQVTSSNLLGGGNINFPIMSCTEIACGSGSREDQVKAALYSATRYALDTNRLDILYNLEACTLKFVAQ